MKPSGRLLIADDNRDVLVSLEMFLRHEFEKVFTTRNPNLIPQLVREERIDVVLLDMNFAAGLQTGNEGIFWMREIHKIDPVIVVVLITAFGDVPLAVKAIKEGGFDFVTKPWDNDKLAATLQAALQLRRSRIEVRMLKEKQENINEELTRQHIVWGSSPDMQKILDTVKKIAPTDANVLILGEHGTGKEMIAREIHRLSSRGKESFVTVDIGAVHENLFESELFGHVKGAFTDAKTDRPGRFEMAHQGSLFLDEIGNLPLYLQSKILSVLQNREMVRVGSNQTIPLDIRLIAATNRDLHQMANEHLFREDLLYRLETITLTLPPLRKRPGDIHALSHHFLQQYALKYGKPMVKLNDKALEKLVKHSWPGNVRELKHAMEKAVILAEHDLIGPEEFLFPGGDSFTPSSIDSLNLENLEKLAIMEALGKSKMNMSLAARELGISRPTLYKKIEKYGLRS